MNTDKNWNHLFPEFRERLEKLLPKLQSKTKLPWVLIEGFRSQARQDYLYAQGRTRPGKIVTWTRNPRWHGVGLAGDIAPYKDESVWYGCPYSYWLMVRDFGKELGLENPVWEKGDFGHLQYGNEELRHKASDWVKRGFKF